MVDASQGYVDLTKEVESVRPDDMDIPREIVSLASFTVPMLLDMVHRREALPPLLIIGRENDDTYAVEPIEEELHGVEDILAYAARRMENDVREGDSRADGFRGAVPPMPIVAYAIAYDERDPIFGVMPEPQMTLHVLMGCHACAEGTAVSQPYRPRLFGGAVLTGPPIIERGPDSLVYRDAMAEKPPMGLESQGDMGGNDVV